MIGSLLNLEERVEEAYEESRDAIYSYLLCFGIPAMEAQELTQETFLRLYQAMSKGDQIENVRGWLYRVAHNFAINLRARKKTFSLSALEGQGLTLLAPDSPERDLLNRERLERFSNSLESLSPQQRNCLELRARGLRYREIADALGIKVSTVGEFLTRAMRRLSEAAK